ncbi:MAG: hypothetical protein K0Q73_5146 [Paenibacillus sp.]|nr:hypothetical protein [Paenibacillus sp.]
MTATYSAMLNMIPARTFTMCSIFPTGGLNRKACPPRGKLAVLSVLAAWHLISGMAGARLERNVIPLRMSFSIAALLPTLLKRSVFDILNITRSNSLPSSLKRNAAGR